MSSNIVWNPHPAKTVEDLMNILWSAGSTLKTQVLASPVLMKPELLELRQRISAIADEVVAMQDDVAIQIR